MMTFVFICDWKKGLCTLMDILEYTVIFTILTQKYVVFVSNTVSNSPLWSLTHALHNFCYCRYLCIMMVKSVYVCTYQHKVEYCNIHENYKSHMAM